MRNAGLGQNKITNIKNAITR